MAAQDLKTEDMCDVEEKVAGVLKKLKFKSSNKTAAVVLKILVNESKVVIDEEFEDITTEELSEELPERQPRFVVYSYKHLTKDGRTTFPLIFIYYHPAGCNPQQVMRYAGSRNKILDVSGATNHLELTESEQLTDEYIVDQLRLK